MGEFIRQARIRAEFARFAASEQIRETPVKIHGKNGRRRRKNGRRRQKRAPASKTRRRCRFADSSPFRKFCTKFANFSAKQNGANSPITSSHLLCSAIEWSNEWRNQCFAKTEDFLSYDTDFSVFFLSTSVLFFFLTLLTLGVFITYQDTPIVRANNRSLSFLLLVSIKLSFLGVFLFLGRPVDITCMLRIITFGITFSIAVSSLLAKTIMVCVAFKATKPGSSWRKWVGVKLFNSVVLFCSSIQIIICMTWLAISPPLENWTFTLTLEPSSFSAMRAQLLAFTQLLGFSFDRWIKIVRIVRFEGFNRSIERKILRSIDRRISAKSFDFDIRSRRISIRGESAPVCVEIFAILTSSAGLLACIFLPKCYIILFRSEINVKTHLFGNKSRRPWTLIWVSEFTRIDVVVKIRPLLSYIHYSKRVIYVSPCGSGVHPPNSACHLEIIKTHEIYENIQEGDIMIGGLLTMNSYALHFFYPGDIFNRLVCVQGPLSDKMKVIFCLAAVWVTLCITELSGSDSQCCIQITKLKHENKHMQDGDIIIGRVFTVSKTMEYISNGPLRYLPLCKDPHVELYREFRTFLFAIDEINKNSDLLPNITLGYHIYDSCGEQNVAIGSVLQILSGLGKVIPNYSCRNQGDIAGFIGDRSSLTSLPVAQLLSVYGYTQISYGTTDSTLNDREIFPYFVSTGLSDDFQNIAVAKLVEQFGWTWVIIVTTANDSGEKQSQNLKNEIIKHGACVEFIIFITEDVYTNKPYFEKIRMSNTEVIILCGTPSDSIFLSLCTMEKVIYEKTLVFTSSWREDSRHCALLYNCSLSYVRTYKLTKELDAQFNDYILSVGEDTRLLKDLLAAYIDCRRQEISNNKYFMNCTQKKTLQEIGVYYRHNDEVYRSVYTIAHALHNMRSVSLTLQDKDIPIDTHRKQLHHYMRNLHFTDPWGRETHYKDFREVVREYLILNRCFIDFRYHIIIVGTIVLSEGELNISMNIQKIIWKKDTKNQTLKSQCSPNCLPGYRKIPGKSRVPCCYDCIPCSHGEISNITDMENCLKCQDNEWPNWEKTMCIERQTEFLSYAGDPLTIVFIISSVILFIIAAVILGIFISFGNTPVVKANNHTLSFILLVSIKLSFLSVFLFLGRPVHITCMLRQISFGITFCIAVSCVLAKTLMVCIAFKATKPGSPWKKWMGIKLANWLVFICSSVQCLISVVWLVISPPFVEHNIHSEPGKIIIQCNEGSVIAFYIVLSYMGLLASVSFIVAFLARTLPDSFNEAKYITFSMLLFCSVWITMIPAYLSTKGKYMVAVEIFAIISSSCGLLFCIFLPKCYIILFKPEMNTKQYLMAKCNT
ncbi:hypothetical protein XELAEV_18004633mg [Xenopus laevis]|uniref:G-protein coupled receptors family 3 profile domain-containing protein n=1 Tax=Xenopus laevis TaxID=8355 RepID=A0A974GZI5_XENLA|nr:hypothetical protein XELAEV_18004633mg [Xenopus laevis]